MNHRRSLSAIFILCILCAAMLAGCGSKPPVTPGNNVQDSQGKSDTDSVTDSSGAADVITTETVVLGYGATAEMTLVNGKYTTGILLYEGKEQSKLTAEYSKAADGTEYVSKVTITADEITSVHIVTLNEKQDILSKITYDENGNTVYSETYEHTYDANGNKTKTVSYSDGKINEESEYVLNANGDIYLKKLTSYTSEGLVSRSHEYDEYGNEILNTVYNNGKLVYTQRSNHVYDENGVLLSSKIYFGDDLTGEHEYSYDNEGNTVCKATLYPRSDSKKRDVRTFVNDVITHSAAYREDGTLESESVYKAHPTKTEYNENGKVIPVTFIYSQTNYDEKGEKLFETFFEYDDAMNVTAKKEYDKDGKLTASYVTKYEFFEHNGTVKKQTEYKNGKLSTENEYAYKENRRYLARNTVYDENGNVTNESIYGYSINGNTSKRYIMKKTSTANGEKIVDEFGEDGSRLSRKVYSADGTLKEDKRYESEYFENGSIKLTKEYNFDKLASTSEYKLEDDTSTLFKVTNYNENGDITNISERSKNQNGKTFVSKRTVYSSDNVLVTEYFDTNKRISDRTYDKDGNLVYEKLYAVGADGNTYLTKETSISERTYKTREYDGKGGFTETTYKVSTKNVTEYDESGKITYKATYENGELVKEERH